MIRTLILYFLSLKNTHGYEIQKFIQINHMDSYTKIQSGSIYYALSKLEKEGLIELYKEEQIGAKTRKIYSITDKGKEELSQCVQKELNCEIYDIGSDKFIIYPILRGLDQEVVINTIKSHIIRLAAKKRDIEKWQRIKVGDATLKVEALCFEMMISSLNYQIKWHEALIEELDRCMNYSKQIAEIIKKVDFSSINDMCEVMESIPNNEVERLKQEILSDPVHAAKKLDELVDLIKNESFNIRTD